MYMHIAAIKTTYTTEVKKHANGKFYGSIVKRSKGRVFRVPVKFFYESRHKAHRALCKLCKKIFAFHRTYLAREALADMAQRKIEIFTDNCRALKDGWLP